MSTPTLEGTDLGLDSIETALLELSAGRPVLVVDDEDRENEGDIIFAAQHATRELLAQHYAEHEGKPFYEPLVEFMLSGPVAALVVEGERVIEGFRSLAGATDPTTAAPGTIRGDLGRDWGTAVQQNLVHGSDAPESAEREIGIWFPEL